MLNDRQKSTLSLLMYKACFNNDKYSRKCIRHYIKRLARRNLTVNFYFQYAGVNQYNVIVERI